MSGRSIDENIWHFTITNDLFKLFYGMSWLLAAR